MANNTVKQSTNKVKIIGILTENSLKTGTYKNKENIRDYIMKVVTTYKAADNSVPAQLPAEEPQTGELVMSVREAIV